MRNFTWNRFPIKNLLIDSLLTPVVESTYLIWKLLRVHEGLDFVSTALNLDKKVKIADLALMKLTPFPCNCKLTSLNFVKISVDCDSQDTAFMTPFDSHLLCAATGVQTLFIIFRVHHIALLGTYSCWHVTLSAKKYKLPFYLRIELGQDYYYICDH